LITCSWVTIGADSSRAMSPATRMRPPSSRRRRVSCPRLPARRCASLMISMTALLSKWGIFLSLATSWATKRTSLVRFSSVSSMVERMYTSYPYPRMRERRAGCMPWIASMFPAHTRMKSQGTGSDFTIAPELRSDCPVMLNLPSCSAVRSDCWDSILSMLISSTKRTPLDALWMAPTSSRSWAGVSRPPDWNGSCLTSPSSAPAWAPVASMNGMVAPSSWEISSLGIM